MDTSWFQPLKYQEVAPCAPRSLRNRLLRSRRGSGPGRCLGSSTTWFSGISGGFTVFHRVSPCFNMFRHVSTCFNAYHHNLQKNLASRWMPCRQNSTSSGTSPPKVWSFWYLKFAFFFFFRFMMVPSPIELSTRHGQVLMNRHVLNDGCEAQRDLPTHTRRSVAVISEGIQIAGLWSQIVATNDWKNGLQKTGCENWSEKFWKWHHGYCKRFVLQIISTEKAAARDNHGMPSICQKSMRV